MIKQMYIGIVFLLLTAACKESNKEEKTKFETTYSETPKGYEVTTAFMYYKDGQIVHQEALKGTIKDYAYDTNIEFDSISGLSIVETDSLQGSFVESYKQGDGKINLTTFDIDNIDFKQKSGFHFAVINEENDIYIGEKIKINFNIEKLHKHNIPFEIKMISDKEGVFEFKGNSYGINKGIKVLEGNNFGFFVPKQKGEYQATLKLIASNGEEHFKHMFFKVNEQNSKSN